MAQGEFLQLPLLYGACSQSPPLPHTWTGRGRQRRGSVAESSGHRRQASEEGAGQGEVVPDGVTATDLKKGLREDNVGVGQVTPPWQRQSQSQRQGGG